MFLFCITIFSLCEFLSSRMKGERSSFVLCRSLLQILGEKPATFSYIIPYDIGLHPGSAKDGSQYQVKRLTSTLFPGRSLLIRILLTWRIWRATHNESRWQMGFKPYLANVENNVIS